MKSLPALLLALASATTYAHEAPSDALASDFDNFKPTVQYAICQEAFRGESAALHGMLQLEELFTEKAKRKLRKDTAQSMSNLALTKSKSWHLPAGASQFAGVYASLANEEGHLIAHCKSWMATQKQKQAFKASDVARAESLAHEFVKRTVEKNAKSRSGDAEI